MMDGGRLKLRARGEDQVWCQVTICSPARVIEKNVFKRLDCGIEMVSGYSFCERQYLVSLSNRDFFAMLIHMSKCSYPQSAKPSSITFLCSLSKMHICCQIWT